MTRFAPPLLALLALLVLLPASARADGTHPHPGGVGHVSPADGRYQLVGFEQGQGLEVLDQVQGLLYLVDLRAAEVAALDLVQGTIVTKKLAEREPSQAERPAPAWPQKVEAKGPRRYRYLRGNAILRGGSMTIFDSETGQVIVVTGNEREVVDAPLGTRSRSGLATKDGTGVLARMQRVRSQSRALIVLQAIARAEVVFRRMHPQLRYGSLEELIAAKIVSERDLEIPGYRIELKAGQGELAQRAFIARAVPEKDMANAPYFGINHLGVVHASKSEIPLSEDGALPADARPLRQPPPPSQPELRRPNQPRPPVGPGGNPNQGPGRY